MRLRGIGRWTADLYLTMCLLRPDVWPHGDQALATGAMDEGRSCTGRSAPTRSARISSGPRAGLAPLGTLEADERMARTHGLEAVRAHLLELAGDEAAARESYLLAARMTASLPERRYLSLRAARLG